MIEKKRALTSCRHFWFFSHEHDLNKILWRMICSMKIWWDEMKFGCHFLSTRDAFWTYAMICLTDAILRRQWKTKKQQSRNQPQKLHYFSLFSFFATNGYFFLCVFFNFFINFCFSTNTSWAFVSGKKNVLGWWEKNYALQLTYIGDPCSGLKKTQLLTASWFCGIAYQVKMTRRRQDCAQQNQKKKVLEILERNFLQLFRRKWKTLL